MTAVPGDEGPPGSVAPFPLDRFIDDALLGSCSPDALQSVQPFPWWNPRALIADETFAELCSQWPELSLFERHRHLPRVSGQRPHDRYYLAYEDSIYHLGRGGDTAPDGGPGVVHRDELGPAWQAFIDELESHVGYRSFMERFLGTSRYRIRYAWHAGTTASEVSPHVDAPEKLGTHIWYFNPEGTWDRGWGGATLALGGKTTEAGNPEFDQFRTVTAIETLGNRSFVFRNTPDAWHGVHALSCPTGAQRRLFNVIFERADVAFERQQVGARRRTTGGTWRGLRARWSTGTR